MIKYKEAYGQLAIGFVVTTFLFSVVAALDLFDLPSAMGLLAMVIAGMLGGRRFVVQNNRGMTAREQAVFSLTGALIMIAISLLLMVATIWSSGGNLNAERISGALRIKSDQLVPTLLVGGVIATMLGTVLTYVGTVVGLRTVRIKQKPKG